MGATKRLLDDMEHNAVVPEQRPQYYINQSPSGQYEPAILTDDLKEEAANQGYAVYDSITECQAACDLLNDLDD